MKNTLNRKTLTILIVAHMIVFQIIPMNVLASQNKEERNLLSQIEDEDDGDDGDIEVEVSNISLNKTSAILKEGESLQLIATVAPEWAANFIDLEWKSSDETVATVTLSGFETEIGIVEAVKKGTATITATAQDGSGVSASCEIIVEEGEGTWEYHVKDDQTVEVTGYSGNETNLVVPDRLDGKAVTSIGERAFIGSNSTNPVFRSELKEITLPASVETIGRVAFDMNFELQHVYFAEDSKLKKIDIGAFDYCTSLKELELPDSVEYIGCRALPEELEKLIYNGKSLKYVGGGNWGGNAVGRTKWAKNQTGLVILGNAVVGYNGTGTEVTIPDTVDLIGVYAFRPYQVGSGGNIVKKLNLGKNTKTILEYGLAGCSNIENIELPDTVSKVAYSAFADCSKLENIILKDGIHSMPGKAGDYDGLAKNNVIKYTDVEYGVEISRPNFPRKTTKIQIPKSVTNLDWYDGLTTTIACYSNSPAHQYAVSKNIEYVLLDKIQPHVHKYTKEEITRQPTYSQTGIKVLTCEECGDRKTEVIPALIIERSLQDGVRFTIKMPYTTANYTGKAICPEPYVAFDGVKLEKDVDYKLLYENNVNIGTASVIVNGIGAYSGTAKQNYRIQILKNGIYINKSFKYKVLNDKDAAFYGLQKKSTKSVSIPKTVTIGGKKFTVSAIADNAIKNASVTNISIGANVKTIGDKAFYGCKKLKKIVIPQKVSSIGKEAFCKCKNLKSITIKTTKLSDKKMGKNALKGISAKAVIKVPKSKYSAYKKMLKKKGIGSKVKIQK